MTVAWYGHLKNTGVPLWKAILAGWGIAFFEYCLMVPASRIGYGSGISGFQLKITQKVITLLVFIVFAVLHLRKPFHWRYLVSFLFIAGAMVFAFWK